MKKTLRIFIKSKEISDFFHDSGVVMITGEDTDDTEGNTYLGMDFVLRRIDHGTSSGSLEIVQFKDLPEATKEMYKELLTEQFEKK